MGVCGVCWSLCFSSTFKKSAVYKGKKPKSCIFTKHAIYILKNTFLVYKSFEALIGDLELIAVEKKKNSPNSRQYEFVKGTRNKAKALACQGKRRDIIILIHFLLDALKVLKMMSEKMQRR